jgi:molybdopterin molybdotransferase
MAQLSEDVFAFGENLMSVEEAVALMAERLRAIAGVETLPLARADGHVLAEDLRAPISLPPFDNSAVDGYAVRHADLMPDGPTFLPVIGHIAAGQAAPDAPMAGCAVRVLTGAPVPPEADVIFMQEDVSVADGRVRLPSGLEIGANLRRAGEDVSAGAVALPAGRRLRPQDLALAAAVGAPRLSVRTPLRVGLFSTGDELREPGEPLSAAQIHDSNRALLGGLLRRMGVELCDLGRLRDDPVSLRGALEEAAGRHDLLVTSGGVSVGDEDHVRAAIAAAGSLVFWRLAIKPGRPVAMGVIGGTPLVGLPGNPVAVFVTSAYVLRPLIARLRGETLEPLARFPVRVGFACKKKKGRREFVRASLRRDADGGFTAMKHARDGAGMLTSLTETAGLVELAEHIVSLEPGETAPFVPYALLW